MTFTVDRRIAELLCSRICHELVAGVAAINNGVELISEIDPSMFDEAMTLIGSSAKQASARVQYYRMAYGFAGHDALSSMAAVGQLISQLVETEDRYGVELPENAASIPLEAGRGKLLLNLTVLGMECLPRGGSVAPDSTVLSAPARSPGDEAPQFLARTPRHTDHRCRDRPAQHTRDTPTQTACRCHCPRLPT